MNMFEDVAKFHEKFGLEPKDAYPNFVSREWQEYRVRFMREELLEYQKALKGGDMEGVLDALVDLCYVAMGTAYGMSLPFEEAWEEVQQANLRKVRTEKPKDSKRKTSLDVVKPKGWAPPDLRLDRLCALRSSKELAERLALKMGLATPLPASWWRERLAELMRDRRPTQGDWKEAAR